MISFQGYTATDLNRHSGRRTPSQGAVSIIAPIEENFLITAREPKCKYVSGGFYQDSTSLSYSLDPKVASDDRFKLRAVMNSQGSSNDKPD